ncbi:outer kinetochore KNL1 complex subunit KNL1 [Urocitellus parryii]
MDGVSSETNEENDNRERPVRRRHSSILKPPRSPLQDLRNGNEIVQESNTLRNKKSSRRVSFADTIKVFQTVSHMKTVRKSEIIETEAGENVLCIQNKNSEDNYCEIAGMNTLLCAPIQIQMQQREFPFTEHNHERKHAGDQTVIFSDENQMDLTASHTVMISKGLLDRTKSEKSTKIETRSFLTNLKHNAEDSRIKNEKLSMDQNTSSEKKKNSSDFIKRLKRGKYSACPSTGPDKENSEILIYSKESNTASSTHQMQVAFNVDENSNNMTRIFQEQDEGMNFTQCHTANIETLVPTTGEANLREFEGDITIYHDDCMDLTVNRTVQILPSADNLSEKENQTQNVKLDVKTVCETKVPGKETFFQNKINASVQDSSLNPQDKIHITRSHIIVSETQTVTQTSNQDTRTLTATPDIQGYKTVFYSSCNDAMELTKCLSSLRQEENLLKLDGNSKMCPSPNGIPFLIEKTIYSGEDSMDITKSHTVAIDNQIFKQEELDVQVAAASISEKKLMLQNPIIVSEDEEMNLSCSSVAHIFKERLQQSSKEPVSISLTDKKTELLAGKVVDLTESHTSNLGSHAPLASYTLITNNTSKSHSQSKSPLDEWEKKIKNITPSPQPNISKNIVTDIQSKEKHRSVNFLPRLNKDPLPSTDYNQNTAINHNIVYSGAVLDKQVLLGNNRHTVLSEQSLFSTSKPLFAIEEQSNKRNVLDDKAVQKPGFLMEKQNVNIHERKSFGGLKIDKTIVFSEGDENDMDITKSYTVELNHRPLLDKNDSHLAGTSKTILYACGQDDMEITASHTTVLGCKTHLASEKTSGPVDKTVMFVDNHDELEMTKSHTVFIDYQAQERTGLPDTSTFELAKRKSLQKSEVASSSEEDKVFFLENNESDNPTAKGSQLTGLKKLSNVGPIEKGVAVKADDSMEVSKLTTRENINNVEKAGFVNEYLSEKKETIWTDSRGQLTCSMTLLKDEDLIKKPQNLSANQTLVYSQNLGEITKLNSKRVSFKLPKDQIEAFVDDICDASQPHLSTQQLPLTQNRQNVICKSEAILSKSGNKSLNFIIENSSPTYENGSKILNNEKQFAIACKKEIQENNQTAKCNTAVDFHSNSNSATQIIQTHTNARNASDHIITSNVPCISSIKPNMNNLNGKTEEFLDSQTVPTLPPQELLLKLGGKAHDNVSVVQPTEIHNINIVSTNAKDNWDEENKNFQNGADTTSVPLKTVVKDKMRRCSLGIFLPRLPNKRNCSVTGIDDLEQIPADTTDINHLEIQQVSRKDSDIGSVAANLNLSPSEYINEENLPICPGEINSSDTISIEIEEKSLIETYQKEILPSENKMEETCNNQKRTWVQEDNDVQKEKKIIKYDIELSDTKDQEIFDHRNEGDIDKNVNSVLIKSLSRTPSSCSSSLDSIKADGTSLDFSTYRSNQMESRFLRDTICEESLREKLKDGRITIREFFILLQVHILIQKPRQSNLPAKFTTNTSPTPEDLILRQYVYGPKIQIYREDCEILRQKIEELKVSSLTQDKLLTDVNRNLWEKMRHSSDEELKAFGFYINKIKSCVTKVTKVFTHQGKVTLYSKLVQSAQNEREKLQIRIDEMDNILKKINNCLSEVEIETKNLEDEEKDNPVEEWDSEMRAAEKELQQLKTKEEELQRKLLELEVQKEQTLAQIDFMQKQTNRTEELLNQLSLSEWDVIEWTDDQAVFTFVYDTIELIITFGEPVVGLPFLDKAHRKITDLNFQSLLDEDKAPTSSLLVHKLIFQYIEEQESWKKKCTTQHQVPKMLQELSPIVNNCRLLGEEIEFLKKWGPNYNLMDIDVNNTELKLLFSSSVAFAKFAVTLSLSAHYPLVPLPFTIQNHLGNTSQDEIAAVIYKVPLADNYLKNIVKQIYQDLLQGCHFYC